MVDEHKCGFEMPLDQKLSWGYHGTVSLLLQGWTPMHCAADIVHPEVMRLLLKACTRDTLNAADVEVRLTLDHDTSFMAYHLWVSKASRLPLSFTCV